MTKTKKRTTEYKKEKKKTKRKDVEKLFSFLKLTLNGNKINVELYGEI